MIGRALVPGVPHKPQGDSKSAVLSLNSGLLPKITAPLKTRRQGECKKKEYTIYISLSLRFQRIKKLSQKYRLTNKYEMNSKKTIYAASIFCLILKLIAERLYYELQISAFVYL